MEFELSSFRDPAGCVFYDHGNVYRYINASGLKNFERLLESDFYNRLISEKKLVNHSDSEKKFPIQDQTYKIIKMEMIPFISYPQEWSPLFLKSAALLTLEIQEYALQNNMSLKDATAYNIQFLGYNPIFIDILSFENYIEGTPWIAYSQFCRNFLAPLLLMSYYNRSPAEIFGNAIDGLDLKFTSSLLPFRSWFDISILMNIHIHGYYIPRIDRNFKKSDYKLKKIDQIKIIRYLHDSINKLSFKNFGGWSNYRNFSNYLDRDLQNKKEFVSNCLRGLDNVLVYDFGSNIGDFSRLASKFSDYVVSVDSDVASVNLNRDINVAQNIDNILPLVIDICNPTPSLGWCSMERQSFNSRIRPGTTLFLAIIHHLVISNNLKFEMVMEWLSKFSKYLVIEFPRTDDSQVRNMLEQNPEARNSYTEQGFQDAYLRYFDVIDTVELNNNSRKVFFMRNKK